VRVDLGSCVVRAVTAHAFREHGLRRVFAVPFAWNGASMRVLEKAGYTLEGRMRQSAFKDGQVVDQLLYAALRDEWPSSGPER
jgi:RimJ/RimL family protein N-acetyltransferase